MVKSAVDFRTDSLEDLQLLLNIWFSDKIIQNFTVLRGGYSGTNYMIECSEKFRVVMKICNGYDIEEIECQAIAADFLQNNHFHGVCDAYKLQNPTIDSIFTALTNDNQPVLLLRYLNGENADVLVESGVITHSFALSEVGKNLALMHSTNGKNIQSIRHFHIAGACFVGNHIRYYYRDLLLSHQEEYIRNHHFVQYYIDRVESLITAVTQNDLPLGILHGDPFLDNVLLDSITGKFR